MIASIRNFASPDRPNSRPTFPATASAMLAMGWPIMAASVAMAVLNLGQVTILAHLDDPTPLYLLSRLQPFYLVFFAILEAFAVTGQVFSARSRRAWPLGMVPIASVLLVGLAMLLVAGAAGAAILINPEGLPAWVGLGDGVSAVLPTYLLSLLPLLGFEILNGVLRGQGRTLPGFVALVIAIVVNLSIVYHAAHLQLSGLEAVMVANAACGVAATLVLVPSLATAFRGGVRGPLPQALARLSTLLGIVGAPVALSLIVSFFSSAIVMEIMAGLNAAYAAGFLVVLRLRLFFIIPAAGLATALAIIVNQEDEDAPADHRRAQLLQGLAVFAIVYGIMTAALWAARDPLIAAVAGQEPVRLAALQILQVLIFSFFAVGVGVAMQVVLENLGRGARVLIWTLALEAVACGGLVLYAHDVDTTLLVLLIVAGGYLAVFTAEFLRLCFARRSEQAALLKAAPAGSKPAAA